MASGRRGLGDSRRDSDAIDNTGPIDVMAVRRDDALIDAIAGDGPVATDSNEEYQLAMLLANWRADVASSPMPAGPDLDDVVAAVNQEIGARQVWLTASQRRGRLRLLRPLGVAAASIAVIAGALMTFSYNSQPGDPLWGFKQVVFSEQANSTVAQREADTALGQAQRNIDQNNPQQAKVDLSQAQKKLPAITDTKARDDLQSRLNTLQQQLFPSGLPTSGAASTTDGTTGHKPSSTTTKPASDSSTNGATPAGSTPPTTASSPAASIGPFPIPTLPTIPSGMLPSVSIGIPTLPPVGPSSH